MSQYFFVQPPQLIVQKKIRRRHWVGDGRTSFQADSGLECKAIGPASTCFCGHRRAVFVRKQGLVVPQKNRLALIVQAARQSQAELHCFQFKINSYGNLLPCTWMGCHGYLATVVEVSNTFGAPEDRKPQPSTRAYWFGEIYGLGLWMSTIAPWFPCFSTVW